MKTSRSFVVETSVLWFLRSCCELGLCRNSFGSQTSENISRMWQLLWLIDLVGSASGLEDHQRQIVGIKVQIKYQQFRSRVVSPKQRWVVSLVTDQCNYLSLHVTCEGKLFRWTEVLQGILQKRRNTYSRGSSNSCRLWMIREPGLFTTMWTSFFRGRLYILVWSLIS